MKLIPLINRVIPFRLSRLSKAALRRQFNTVIEHGWLPYFEEAAEKYGAGDFDTADLIAIGSRETNLDKKWTTMAGDHGNGFGLMQVDKRYFPDWVKTGEWRLPRKSIAMGGKVLQAKFRDAKACQGVRVTVRDKKGRSYEFIGKRLSADELYLVGLAAYNSGRWGHYHISKGRSADHGTTDKDYSADVSARAKYIRAWLKELPAYNLATTETPSASENQTVAQTEKTEDCIKIEDITNHLSVNTFKSVWTRVGTRVLAALGFVIASIQSGNILTILVTSIVLIGIIYGVYKTRKQIKQFILKQLRKTA